MVNGQQLRFVSEALRRQEQKAALRIIFGFTLSAKSRRLRPAALWRVKINANTLAVTASERILTDSHSKNPPQETPKFNQLLGLVTNDPRHQRWHIAGLLKFDGRGA